MNLSASFRLGDIDGVTTSRLKQAGRNQGSVHPRDPNVIVGPWHHRYGLCCAASVSPDWVGIARGFLPPSCRACLDAEPRMRPLDHAKELNTSIGTRITWLKSFTE